MFSPYLLFRHFNVAGDLHKNDICIICMYNLADLVHCMSQLFCYVWEYIWYIY